MSGGHLVCLADIKVEEVEWIWPGYVPAGMLSLLVGEPGVGKSSVSRDLCARLTTGSSWPDGTESELGDVLLISGEDQLENRVTAQLHTFDANLNRVHSLDEQVLHFRLDGDLRWLEDDIARRGIRLVVIDPFHAFLGAVNPNKGMDVRRVTNSLSDIAKATGAAIVLVHHLNKNEKASVRNRVLGSVDLLGAARCVLEVKEDLSESAVKVLHQIKNNLGAPAAVLLFEWSEKEKLEWRPAPAGYDPLCQQERDGVVAIATKWLESLMEEHGGEMRAQDLNSEASAAGISSYALHKAKAKLGYGPKKVGGAHGYWVVRKAESASSGLRAG